MSNGEHKQSGDNMSNLRNEVLECFSRFNKKGKHRFLDWYSINHWCNFQGGVDAVLNELVNEGIIEKLSNQKYRLTARKG